MSNLAATGLPAEIADASTTIERRSEIAQGFDNATFLQSGVANTIWWLALIATLLVAIVAFWGFRLPTGNAPVA